jgi:fatty-acyl-CoA synthase
MLSTMQDYPLTINMMYRHGRRIYSGSRIRTFEGDHCREASFGQIGDRAERLAGALRRLGVRPGDRVGTFCWNHQEHMECYLAVPCMGAVLHTLNIRLFPEQLSYVVNHAADKVVIVDDTLAPLLAGVLPELRTVEAFILVGKGDGSALAATGKPVLRYEELLAGESLGYPWPEIDERSAAAMCYTSGTTGNPKGVVYGHRSTVLHSFAAASGAVFALNERDRVLLIVPMFHANAWGLPYVAWMVGADFVMPQRWLQAEPLCKMISEEKPTVTGAVPTILNDILRWAEKHPVDFSSLRFVLCGGSAVPRALMEAYESRHGINVVQGWGMTETSPLAARAIAPKGTPPEEAMDWRAKTGRIVPGVELRIVDDGGKELPWDGTAVGEIQIRGPWVTASYYLDDDPQKFQDGWLRTGDVGTLDSRGFIQITDRAKDVIKSGGEWISSVDLENHLMAHPDVIEAAVIGVPDSKWDERPLACVVLREEAQTRPEELRAFLNDRVARWWLPSKWAFIEQIPKTSVGKFDKKVLRARYGDSAMRVVDLEAGSQAAS